MLQGFVLHLDVGIWSGNRRKMEIATSHGQAPIIVSVVSITTVEIKLTIHADVACCWEVQTILMLPQYCDNAGRGTSSGREVETVGSCRIIQKVCDQSPIILPSDETANIIKTLFPLIPPRR